uniref:Si:ch211-15p9.2 n=1 Tax=Sinocyclocheilus grahami TaxID=75366 RepID=A0A672QMI5_SINGR
IYSVACVITSLRHQRVRIRQSDSNFNQGVKIWQGVENGHNTCPELLFFHFKQINHVLKANEYSLKPNGYGLYNESIKGFDSNIIPSNSPSEDRWSAAMCFQSRGSVSERLFYYISVSLLPLKTLTEIEEAVESEQPVLPVLQWHKHPNDFVSTDAGKLYFNSPGGLWGSFCSFHTSGCMACVGHVDREDLHVANNMGDSRAVLAVQGDDGRWSALTITNDHNAHNPDKIQRVLLEHSASERNAVVGLLIPFRAFGDMKFKRSIVLLNCIYEACPELLIGNENAKLLLPGCRSKKWLPTATAVCVHFGWDKCRTAAKRKGRALSALEDENSDTHLISHTLGSDGYSIEPKRIVKMLSLPQDLARMYRDDNYIILALFEINFHQGLYKNQID